MDPIYIPALTRAPAQTEVIAFSERLPDLETLMPVKGELRVAHRCTYLEVSAHIETIVTLTCNRCLQQYNYRLDITPTELIWLDEAAAVDDVDSLLEQDLTSDDLVESLPPEGTFDPTTWIYEQVCLALPQRQLCDAACPGIPLSTAANGEGLVDRRWASLEALRQQLDNN